MPGLLAWVSLGAFIALAIFLSFRKKAAKPQERKHEEWSSDLILDLGQKRFHDAMKEHLLKERNSESDWQTFQYIHVLPGGDRMKPQDSKWLVEPRPDWNNNHSAPIMPLDNTLSLPLRVIGCLHFTWK